MKTDIKTKSLSKAQQQKQRENGSKKTKASLFNFIVYTHEERRVSYFRDLVDSVIQQFPCRIIFIKGNTSPGEDIFKTEYSLKTAGDIACDFTEIQAGGTHLLQVPFYILPHLEPDRPNYLLWGQDPTQENEVLPQLKQYANRLIYDSESSSNLQDFSKKILNVLKDVQCDAIDMNWARFAGFRNAFINIYDSESKIQCLRNSKEIFIRYNGISCSSFHQCRMQADYLQGWLATRLGWKYHSLKQIENAATILYTYDNKEISVTMQPVSDSTFPSGALLYFESHSFDDQVYKIERLKENPKQLIINYFTEERCNLPFSIPLLSRETGSSFIKQLLYSFPSSHYTDMLHIINKEELQ